MPLFLFSSKNDKIPGLASARRFFAKGFGPTKISVHTMAYAPDVSTPPSSPAPTEPMSTEAPPYESVSPILAPLTSRPEVPPEALPVPGSAWHTPNSGYNSALPSSNSAILPTPIIAPAREPTTMVSSHRSPRPATAINAADYFKHRQRYQHSETEMRLSPSITLVRPSPLPLPTLPPIHLTLPQPQGENLTSVPSLYDRHAAHDGEVDEGTVSEGDEVDDAASDFSGVGSSVSGTRSAEVVAAAIPNPTPPHSHGPRRLPPDSIIPQDPISFAGALPDPHAHTGVITPRHDSSLGDYFSKLVAPSSSAQTPRSVDFNMVPAGRSESPISSSFRRLNLYQHASKSMINLGSPTFVAPIEPKAPLNPPLSTPVVTETLPPAKGTSRPQTATMRRCSLPNMAKAPPPYSALFPIRPRDDEGREKLPAYSCPVHMEGTLHRKMEFSGPGTQARDRSWRKLFFVLNGTSLRVYKADPRKVAIKQQPSPDRSKMTGIQIDGSRMETEDDVDISAPHVHFPVEAMSPTTQKQTLAAIAKESAAHRQTQQQMLHWPVEEEPGRWTADNVEQRATRRTSSNSTASNSRLRLPSPILSASIPTASESSSSTALASGTRPSSLTPIDNSVDWSISDPKLFSEDSARPSFSKTFSPNPLSSPLPSSRFSLQGPFSSGNVLLRQYTLQHAESGLGSDYLKRSNVMRIRVEGEQFLLQAKNVMDVVNWIEAFQAATNVALDLDERTMPKVPPLPRRRRRRRTRAPPTVPTRTENPGSSRHH